MSHHNQPGKRQRGRRRNLSIETIEYKADDLKLRFHGPSAVIAEMRPIFDEVMQVFGAARGFHVKGGAYDIVLVGKIRVDAKPGLELVACAYSPDGELSHLWERVRKGWPPFFRELVPGSFIAISMSRLVWFRSRLGDDAMLVDLADTLHHELIHLSTGVLHEGEDDVCLQDSERFMKKALEAHPLEDQRAEKVLLRAAALRRQTGHG